MRVAMLLCASIVARGTAASVGPARRGGMRLARSHVRLSATATNAPPSVPTLDAKLVADSPDVVADALKRRHAGEQQFEALRQIGELQRSFAALSGGISSQLAIRKQLSPKIGALMKEGKEAEAVDLKAQVAEASAEAKRMEEELAAVEAQRDALLAALPNLLDVRVPDGEDEASNELVAEWTPPSGVRAETGKWHDEIAAELGGLDTERAAKLSGARFSVLRGSVARLERALVNFFLDMHTQEHGYTEASVPLLVGRSALEGTGQLPKFEEDLFALSAPLNGRDGFLIPTAEVPLTNLHAGEILSEAELPLAFVACTPCFRAEAGSHGRDTRGLIRQHQFSKVELVRVTAAADSDAAHEALTAHAEACLRALELPYRKMRLCAGDIGFSARHCYDLEVWLPGQGMWREISSCSNCGDFQARRMGLRYRPAAEPGAAAGKKKGAGPKPVWCHTMNGSGLAVGRALVAVLENYWQEDGSVSVPEALRPYMGGVSQLLPDK